MIVAAGGGGRDLDVDAAIWSARADARSGALNERLMNDLPPTLFLAQLSICSSSLTFMGEEAVGVDAVRIARPKIASGQSEIALIGAAHNGQRKEMPMLYEMRRLQSQKGLHVGRHRSSPNNARRWYHSLPARAAHFVPEMNIVGACFWHIANSCCALKLGRKREHGKHDRPWAQSNRGNRDERFGATLN
jgi:acetyl-CoA acetyltransferase